MIFGFLNLSTNKNFIIMKKLVIILSFIGIAGTIKLQGQQPSSGSRWGKGEDSINCLRNYTLYREFIKQQDYKTALPYWKYTFVNCPLGSRNIYIDGVKIYKYFIEKEILDQNKLLYLDTLIQIYDQRIKYFPKDKGDQLIRKGIDIIYYAGENIKYVDLAFKNLKEGIHILKKETTEAGFLGLFNAANILYKNNLLSPAEYVKTYIEIIPYLEPQLSKAIQDNKEASQFIDKIDALFTSAGIQCDTINKYYKTFYENNQNNQYALKSILSTLKANGCMESDLFFNVSKSYYQLDPTPDAAYMIALMAINKKNYNEAIKYLKEAIDKETNNEKKANYYYNLAVIYFTNLNNKIEARENARKAISLRPNWGEPYILIAKMYADSEKECTELRGSVYWVAVDMLIKAKNIDPSIEQDANKLIEYYSSRYPKKEDAFFLGVYEGSPFTVKCWINETTKARF